MKRRRLGPTLEVSALGLGCMGMSEFYGTCAETQSLEAIGQALDLGIDFFDTADMYGLGKNEELVGRALAGRARRDIVIATKFGIVRDASGRFTGLCGRPDFVRAACTASLRRLSLERIPLYYCHRIDPAVPVEETIGAMAELVREGKVQHLGLCEVSAETLRRAHAVHPIAAVQSEYSLWDRELESSLFPTLEAIGVGFVAYGALGRGYLTGTIRSQDDLESGDTRRRTPRFQPDAVQQNVTLLEPLLAFAREKAVTPAEVALAWAMQRRPYIVPLAGTKKASRVRENARAWALELTTQELDALAACFPAGAVAGERYAAKQMQIWSTGGKGAA